MLALKLSYPGSYVKLFTFLETIQVLFMIYMYIIMRLYNIYYLHGKIAV